MSRSLMRRRDDRPDGALHAIASAGMFVVCAAMAYGIVQQRECDRAYAAEGPNLDEMEAIEASIAYKKAAPKAQPQKAKRAPAPVVEPEGVSRDAEKPVVEPPKPQDKPVRDQDPLAKFRRDDQDEELAVGTPVDEPGVFDPDAPP